MVKLDVKDRKILMELDEDASQSYSQIAKKVRLSKESVSYRIKRMEEKGIIVNYITLSHFAKTGMTHFKVYVRYSKISDSQRKEALNYLSKFNNIGWLASTEGTFDLMFSIRFPTIFEFENFIDAFKAEFDSFFHTIEVAILTEAETKPRMYIYDRKKEGKIFLHCNEQSPEMLDREDRKILELLNTNARKSYRVLSQESGITERVIKYRRKLLEKKGIIVGYKLAIDYKILNYIFFKCFIYFQEMDKEGLKKFRQYVRSHPNIIYWIKTISSWDLELEIEAPSVEKVYKILSEMKNEFSDKILRVDTTLVSKEHKIAHA